ncbi:TMEM175 family protein [Aureibaculum sp. 2210JD6-5]|uniref:TMEM175 family protein n=1 Tax=Aureibaculum sp. 2210JD6-5 TaxID=3103957 RepID=UPI002AADB84C|nr:TMEM175 family protein [Aureibaculum sp. 2210JD6-5]MDY7394468.1 TMEM175 family protein [Aureibaculum sp. 2210JD6-5]
MPILKQSKSRLESISDSIFAFAATLVVVSLDVPESFEVLKENLFGFFSFAVSFLGLILIWKVHYNFFRRIEKIDNWIIALNMALLFVILFFVYPLKFLSNLTIGKGTINSMQDLSELFQLYGLGFTLVFLFISLMYLYASRSKSDISNRAELRYYSRHFSIFVIVGIISIIIAKLNLGMSFGLPGFAFFLLGPLCWWYGVKFGVKEK